MRWFFLILFLSITTLSFSQNNALLQKAIDRHLEKLRVSGALDNEIVGINGEKIDSVASFPGGKSGLFEHCKKIIDEIWSRPRFTRRLPTGKFTIWISFIVNSDGSLSDFRQITQFGYAMEEAVIEVYQRSGIWIPAKSNGINISSRVKVEYIFHNSGSGYNRFN